MARFDTTGLEELIGEMQRLGNDEGPVAEEMVNAAVEAIKEEWKKSALYHEHYKTGALIRSIGIGPGPVRAGNIIYRDVYPHGRNAKGTRNAEVAFILHYGCERFRGSYWVDDADDASAEPVRKACQAIWDRFLASAGK